MKISHRAHAQVAERDQHELQETLQALHDALSRYIRETPPPYLTRNAAAVLQSVEQVELLPWSEITNSLPIGNQCRGTF